jgi:hypothetical protein
MPLVNSSSDEGEGNSFTPTETTDTESDEEEFFCHATQGGNAELAVEAFRFWNECVLEKRGVEDSSDEEKEVESDAKQSEKRQRTSRPQHLQKRDARISKAKWRWNALALTGVILFIGGLGQIALDTRLANSGKPPHPGPDQVEQSSPEDKPRDVFILTHEQQALIATNRQIANHRKAMKAAQKDKPQEAQSEARMLTEKETQKMEKSKAKAIRRATRAEHRKQAQEAIERIDSSIQQEEQKKFQPVHIDLTLTPDLDVKLPIPSIDLTKPDKEQDPLWTDLASKGQILVELINTTAAWKHRACLTERAATLTMLTEHSIPKSKLTKFLNYISREGKTPLCTPTVPGGHALGGVGSITTQARRAIQVTHKTEAFRKANEKGRIGIFAVNLIRGKTLTYVVLYGHTGGRKDPKQSVVTNVLLKIAFDELDAQPK